MGNVASQSGKSKKSLEHIVNYIAAQYIRKQNFKDMINLSDLKFCDDLIILTSKIIEEYLDESSVEYLAVKKGVDGEKVSRDNIIAINKSTLASLDIHNPTKKKRLCIGIAKHYIQIAHIFAAIASTLNPQYNYKDDTGNKVETALVSKENVPEDAKTKITRNNLCSNRLKILLGSMDYNDMITASEIIINPKFCTSTCDPCTPTGSIGKKLDQEPGIPELKHLYLDKYDYDSGVFTGMTPENEKVYLADVKNLYKVFSGNTTVPPTIKNFSDIPLKDFYNSEGCVNNRYNKSVTGSVKEILFQEYANNIKEMMVTIKKYNGELLNILDKIFVFGINPDTKDKQILINPKLNDASLHKITTETRNIIIKLYSFCETSYIKGLKSYEAIVKRQKLDTTQSQITNLKSTLEEKLDSVIQTHLVPEKSDPMKSDPMKSDPMKSDPMKSDAKKFDAKKFDAENFDAENFQPKKSDAENFDAENFQPKKSDAENFDAENFDAENFQPKKFEPERPEAERPEAARPKGPSRQVMFMNE